MEFVATIKTPDKTVGYCFVDEQIFRIEFDSKKIEILDFKNWTGELVRELKELDFEETEIWIQDEFKPFLFEEIKAWQFNAEQEVNKLNRLEEELC